MSDDAIDQFLDDSYGDHDEDDAPIHPPMVVDRKDIAVDQKETVIENAQADYEFVRTNIKQIIETNINGLGGLAKVAQESESPRAYEVLSTYMKQMIDANESLVNLHKTMKDMVDPSGEGAKGGSGEGEGAQTHNHFYGTTEEFLEMLENAEAKSIPIDAEFTETDG